MLGNRMTARRFTGDVGEGLACKYLEKNGYKIIARNVSNSFGEIDIIACKYDTVHFVEVKTVKQKTGGKSTETFLPMENLHSKKVKKVYKAAQRYINEKNIEGEWQVDAALVYLNPVTKQAKVEYIMYLSTE